LKNKIKNKNFFKPSPPTMADYWGLLRALIDHAHNHRLSSLIVRGSTGTLIRIYYGMVLTL
jgi:hypothetical protein